MKYLLQVLSLLFSLNLFAQNTTREQVDSLKKELRNDLSDSDKASAYLMISSYFLVMNTDSSIHYSNESLKHAKLAKDQVAQAKALTRIGIGHSMRNEFSDAMEYLKEAQAMYDLAPDPQWQAMIFNEYGIIHLYQQQLREAIPMFRQSIVYKQEIGDSVGISKTLNNIAGVYERLDMYDSSLYYHWQSIALKEKLGYIEGVAYSKSNVSSILFKQGKYPESMKEAKESLAIFDKLSNRDGRIYSLNMVSENYRVIGKFQEAIRYQQEALEESRKLKILRRIQDSHRKLAAINEEMGAFEKALYHERQFRIYKDSVDNERNIRRIEQVKAEYEIGKREIEIDKQKEELKRKELERNALIGGSLLLILVALLIINRQKLSIRNKAKAKELAELKLAKTKDELELREQELLTYVISIAQKNNLLHNVKEVAKKTEDLGEANKRLKKINHEIENGYNLNQQWEEFREKFEKIHQRFFDQLAELASDLTNTDRRICAYLKLGLSSKQISNLQNVSVESVEVRRSQIRGKLGLSKEDNLSVYIQNIS